MPLNRKDPINIPPDLPENIVEISATELPVFDAKKSNVGPIIDENIP